MHDSVLIFSKNFVKSKLQMNLLLFLTHFIKSKLQKKIVVYSKNFVKSKLQSNTVSFFTWKQLSFSNFTNFFRKKVSIFYFTSFFVKTPLNEILGNFIFINSFLKITLKKVWKCNFTKFSMTSNSRKVSQLLILRI